MRKLYTFGRDLALPNCQQRTTLTQQTDNAMLHTQRTQACKSQHTNANNNCKHNPDPTLSLTLILNLTLIPPIA